MASAPLSEDRDDVSYGVLDLAVLDAFGLGEFRNQWPRDAVVAALLALVKRGLVVIGPCNDLGALADQTAGDLARLLDDPQTWASSDEEWRSGTYVAVLATDAGVHEYERLTAERDVGPKR
jgi:hypothetical protein